VISAENLLARRRAAIKIDGKSSCGLGLMLTEQQGLLQVTHGGNTLGFSADMFFLPEHGTGMVVFANLRAANLFLASIRQRLLEVLFGAESKAEAMVTAGKKVRDDGLEQTRQRVKTDPAATGWISAFVGRFVSEELGLHVFCEMVRVIGSSSSPGLAISCLSGCFNKPQRVVVNLFSYLPVRGRGECRPKAKQRLKGSHRLTPTIVPKDELIQVDLKLPLANTVVRAD
jgi:hypothetical protein